ncbi:hypothetical protein PM082_011046 [Marasmius tenuissimus]|nr:hypothetical protein PM082_011046 [Marasmius tenuissimus]
MLDQADRRPTKRSYSVSKRRQVPAARITLSSISNNGRLEANKKLSVVSQPPSTVTETEADKAIIFRVKELARRRGISTA